MIGLSVDIDCHILLLNILCKFKKDWYKIKIKYISQTVLELIFLLIYLFLFISL